MFVIELARGNGAAKAAFDQVKDPRNDSEIRETSQVP